MMGVIRVIGEVIYIEKIPEGMRMGIYSKADGRRYMCIYRDEYKPERCRVHVEAELVPIKKELSIFSSSEEEYEVVGIRRMRPH